MGDRIKSITRRVKRFLGGKVLEEPQKNGKPKEFSTSRVIRPEAIKDESAVLSQARTRAHRRPTTRRRRPPTDRPAAPKEAVEISTLPCGTVHIRFNRINEVRVKDPITRRVERRIVVRGVKTDRIERTTTYYDKSGTLIGSGDDWGNQSDE